jgi:LacI family transcriptional regulator, gluconate utilization system Gnt-I transcriptional repressor
MLVLNSRYSEIEEEKAIETLLGYHPEAMIIVGVDQSERSRAMLKNSGIPVVQTMDVTDTPIDMIVGFDHRVAGAAAVRHLQSLGHRRIAHLTVRTDPRAARRHLGYVEAMGELGLRIDGLVEAAEHPSTVAGGGQMFAEILRRAPDVTAVFTCNDDLALGAMFECHRRGIRVPQDVAIVGFNDLDFCEASVPPLTSVATERREMGTWSGRAIVEIIRGAGKRPRNPQVDMGFEMRVRGSSTTSKPARSSGAKVRA